MMHEKYYFYSASLFILFLLITWNLITALIYIFINNIDKIPKIFRIFLIIPTLLLGGLGAGITSEFDSVNTEPLSSSDLIVSKKIGAALGLLIAFAIFFNWATVVIQAVAPFIPGIMAI